MKPTNKRFITKAIRSFILGLSFAIGLLSMALLAVAVNGTINTFTSGETLDAAKLNTNFASLKTAVEGIPSQKSMRLIYEYDVPSAVTSVSIPGLDGNTDLNYFITTRIIENAANVDFFIQLNSDANIANYGSRSIAHTHIQAPFSGNPNTQLGIYACGHGSSGASGINIGKFQLYAKSGTRRMSSHECGQYTSNAAWQSQSGYSWWTDSSSNITTMTFTANIANGIGAGSHIEVWARR